MMSLICGVKEKQKVIDNLNENKSLVLNSIIDSHIKIRD